ncbi:MAG: YkgJ family cysteine cluster protein [Deferrisomatales bacterium]
MGLWERLLGGATAYIGTGTSATEGIDPGPGHGPSPRPRLYRWLGRRMLPARSTPAQPACRACGACCELFGGHLRATPGDLERWRAQGRDDLLGRVNRLGWLWVDPATGAPVSPCPFFQRTTPASARCQIHDTKPEMCRAYPTLAHGGRCVRGRLVH